MREASSSRQASAFVFLQSFDVVTAVVCKSRREWTDVEIPARVSAGVQARLGLQESSSGEKDDNKDIVDLGFVVDVQLTIG